MRRATQLLHHSGTCQRRLVAAQGIGKGATHAGEVAPQAQRPTGVGMLGALLVREGSLLGDDLTEDPVGLVQLTSVPGDTGAVIPHVTGGPSGPGCIAERGQGGE